MYELAEADGKHFCNNLSIESNNRLIWDSGSEVDSLIISMPSDELFFNNVEQFRKDIIFFEEKIKDILNDKGINLKECEDSYISIGDNIYIMKVSKIKKNSSNGINIHIPGREYLVLGIKDEYGITYIYRPLKNDFSIFKNSKLKMECDICFKKKNPIQGRTRINKPEEGYYVIDFLPFFNSGYKDGALIYRIDNCVIPITQRMIDNKRIFVKKTALGSELVVEAASSQIDLSVRRQ